MGYGPKDWGISIGVKGTREIAPGVRRAKKEVSKARELRKGMPGVGILGEGVPGVGRPKKRLPKERVLAS